MIDPLFNLNYGSKWRVKYVIYLVAQVFFMVLFRILFRMRVYGLKNIPRSGGALMISNHVHNADPVLMMAACPRPTHFMAKEEIWKVPVANWIAGRQIGRHCGGRTKFCVTAGWLSYSPKGRVR
jgi:1-acyl-sn-glycerol-3-phosphate acyltransferase